MRLAAVICTALLASIGLVCLGLGSESHAQELTQHHERKDADKSPRALALVQISDKGKAHLIPIAIMMNGKFYDAESFKATPVPMALDFGIVYEGFRSGVSQGLFTITQPGQLNHEWIAEGTWLPEGAKAKTDTRKYAPPVIDEGGKDDDHPVLHRRAGGEADKDDAKPGTAPSTSSPSPTPSAPSTLSPSTSSSSSSTSSTTPGSTPPSGSKGSDQSPAAKTPDTSKAGDAGKTSDSAASKAPDSGAAKPSDSASRTSDPGQPISDPNRPILRRGKPDSNAHHDPYVNFDDPAQAAAASKEAGKEADAAKAVASASVQTIPAISDAGGPDPRPYTYDLKPAEEAIYRNKMLELAGQQLRSKTAGAKAASSAASARKNTSSNAASAKTAKPGFEDISLRIFDLSNSNEPILVLSARTPVPPATASGAQVPREITLIARTNLEGELQKLFFAQTDSRHLDLSPRMELIDAVDADGDGRGELLFRRTFESGSAYAIYRVTADRLWPLWEPAP